MGTNDPCTNKKSFTLGDHAKVTVVCHKPTHKTGSHYARERTPEGAVVTFTWENETPSRLVNQ
jgi:hypothetical protein